MLSLPALLAFGLPPHLAFGIYRLGVFGFDLGGLIQYVRNKKVVWEYVVPLSVIAIVSGLIGGSLVLSIDETVLSRSVGLFLILLLPVVLFKPTLGIAFETTSKHMKSLGYGAFGLASIYGASIAIGQGMFLVYSIMYFFGLPLINTIATAKIPSALTSLAVLLLFGISGHIDWVLAAFLFLGMTVGSFIGAHYAIKLGNVWLRVILLIAIGALGVKLLLGV